MKKQISLLFMFAAILPLTAHAAEFTISETESAIVVEYFGEPDGTQSNVDAPARDTMQNKPSSIAAAMPKVPSATATAIANATKPKPATENEAAEPLSPREIERSEARAVKMKARAALQSAQAERAARYSKAPSSSDPYFPPSFEDR